MMVSSRERVLLNKIENAEYRNKIWHRLVGAWAIALSFGIGGLFLSGGFYVLAWIVIGGCLVVGGITLGLIATEVADNHGEWPGQRLRVARQEYTDFVWAGEREREAKD